jgi:hypothetical protein
MDLKTGQSPDLMEEPVVAVKASMLSNLFSESVLIVVEIVDLLLCLLIRKKNLSPIIAFLNRFVIELSCDSIEL